MSNNMIMYSYSFSKKVIIKEICKR